MDENPILESLLESMVDKIDTYDTLQDQIKIYSDLEEDYNQPEIPSNRLPTERWKEWYEKLEAESEKYVKAYTTSVTVLNLYSILKSQDVKMPEELESRMDKIKRDSFEMFQVLFNSKKAKRFFDIGNREKPTTDISQDS